MARECFICGTPDMEIVGVDDCSVFVFCNACNEEFRVEPDGLNEGGMEWVEAMQMQEDGVI